MAGGIYEQSEWPDSRSDYVQVCDGCHTAIWSTRWNEETSDGFDAFLARNGWRHYFLRDDLRVLDLCPDCAARALRLGEIRTLADCWMPGALLHARRPGGLRPTVRPRTDGGEPAADRRLTKTEHLAAPAQTQTPRNGHNAGNGWTGSFPSPCFLLSATENPSVGSIPTSGTP